MSKTPMQSFEALFHASPSMPEVSPEAGVAIVPHLNRARPELMEAVKAAEGHGAVEVRDRLRLMLLEVDDLRNLCGED